MEGKFKREYVLGTFLEWKLGAIRFWLRETCSDSEKLEKIGEIVEGIFNRIGEMKVQERIEAEACSTAVSE